MADSTSNASGQVGQSIFGPVEQALRAAGDHMDTDNYGYPKPFTPQLPKRNAVSYNDHVGDQRLRTVGNNNKVPNDTTLNGLPVEIGEMIFNQSDKHDAICLALSSRKLFKANPKYKTWKVVKMSESVRAPQGGPSQLRVRLQAWMNSHKGPDDQLLYYPYKEKFLGPASYKEAADEVEEWATEAWEHHQEKMEEIRLSKERKEHRKDVKAQNKKRKLERRLREGEQEIHEELLNRRYTSRNDPGAEPDSEFEGDDSADEERIMDDLVEEAFQERFGEDYDVSTDSDESDTDSERYSAYERDVFGRPRYVDEELSGEE